MVITQTPLRMSFVGGGELTDALRALPFTVAELRSIDEITDVQTTGGAKGETPAPLDLTETPSLHAPELNDQLATRFPNEEQRQSFVRQVLDLSDGSLRHAFAVSKLSHEFEGDRLANLTAAGRENVKELVQDHAKVIERSQAELRNLITWCLSPPEALPEPVPAAGNSAASELLQQIKRQHEALLRLFTSNTLRKQEGSAVCGEFLTSSERAEVSLRSLIEGRLASR